MPIPSEITALKERLNQELDRIEQEAAEGLRLARICLERFGNNQTLVGMSAFLNSAIFYAGTERRRIEIIIETLSESNLTTEAEIQEAGEDLATKLGRVLETKTTVINLKNRLENLQ